VTFEGQFGDLLTVVLCVRDLLAIAKLFVAYHKRSLLQAGVEQVYTVSAEVCWFRSRICRIHASLNDRSSVREPAHFQVLSLSLSLSFVVAHAPFACQR